MTHWGWYWKVKRKHRRKEQCERFVSLDSFEMFRNKDAVEACMDTVIYEIPRYNLAITLRKTSSTKNVTMVCFYLALIACVSLRLYHYLW
jgi:hypothetical protein